MNVTKVMLVEDLRLGYLIRTGFGSTYEIRGLVAPEGIKGFRKPVGVHLTRTEGTEGPAATVYQTETNGGDFMVVCDLLGNPITKE